MNTDKARWLQCDSARSAACTDQLPLDEEALRADGGRHIAPINQSMVGRRKE